MKSAVLILLMAAGTTIALVELLPRGGHTVRLYDDDDDDDDDDEIDDFVSSDYVSNGEGGETEDLYGDSVIRNGYGDCDDPCSEESEPDSSSRCNSYENQRPSVPDPNCRRFNPSGLSKTRGMTKPSRKNAAGGRRRLKLKPSRRLLRPRKASPKMRNFFAQ